LQKKSPKNPFHAIWYILSKWVALYLQSNEYVNWKETLGLIGRIKTGINDLDPLLNGGIPYGSVISIKGQHGSGKSIFGRQFLAHNFEKHDSPLLLILLEEDVSELIASSLVFGWDFEKHAERQQTFIVDLTPTRKISDDALNEFIFPEGYAFIHKKEYTPANFNRIVDRLIKDLSPTRIVIDSITPILLSNIDVVQARRWMVELVTILKQQGATTLLVSERTYPPAFDMVDLSIADGIISLNIHMIDNSKMRYLVIEKMRKTKHTMSPIVFRIEKNGINVYPDDPVFVNPDMLEKPD
jgi:circadian clock protein KaiC